MSEAAADRDPAIKLFGRMIAVVDLEEQVEEGVDFGAEAEAMVEDEKDFDFVSTSLGVEVEVCGNFEEV